MTMDKLLFLLCGLLVAMTPANGQGIDTSRKPDARIPEEDAGKRSPPGRTPDASRESASTGASAPQRRGGTDLGFEAEKEEEEFLKKRRTAPLKGR
jgi:hypothetical protein